MLGLVGKIGRHSGKTKDINPDAVSFTLQPVGGHTDVDSPIVLSVAAVSGDGSALSYQWEVFFGVWGSLSNSPPTFSGVTTNTLTYQPSTESELPLRCVVTNSQGPKNSATAIVSSVSDIWILGTGRWRDIGRWVDLSKWIDGV